MYLLELLPGKKARKPEEEVRRRKQEGRMYLPEFLTGKKARKQEEEVRRRKLKGGMYLLELLPGKEAVPIQVQVPEGGLNLRTRRCTANEGPVRIQYKCLVPIYVFPEMKLQGFVISKTEL